ncbi:hypothetical protein EON80_20555 [bacterium]|nr:MAG: hypothetical protein EON80_20555 [bacterium]
MSNKSLKGKLRFCISLGLALGTLVCPTAHGQETTAPVGKTQNLKDPPPPPELDAMMVPFRRARYHQFIKDASAALAKMDKPDPHILYWKATAERKVGQLEEAKQDFAPLGDFIAWPKYPTASSQVAELETMLKLRPDFEKDIVIGGKIVFKFYYSEENDHTRSIMKALPAAYLAASKLLNNQFGTVPVYFFSSREYDRFVKFYTLLDEAPHSWWQFLSSKCSITISQINAEGNPLWTHSLDRSFAHELTHVHFQRTLGSIPDFPNWFNEGAAQLVETSLDPSLLSTNDRRIHQLVQQDAILPLEVVASHSQFHQAVDSAQNGIQKGDPYAQGLNMTRYLGLILKGAKLSGFIQKVADKGSFAGAVQESAGLTVPEFYDEWFKEISREDQ